MVARSYGTGKQSEAMRNHQTPGAARKGFQGVQGAPSLRSKGGSSIVIFVARSFSGCPSIRTKALSRDTDLSQCFWHRVVARGWRTKNSGNLTVNHVSVKRIVPPTIDTA